MIQWARDGGRITEWSGKIEPIMQRYCVSCHGPGASLPDFTQFENLKKAAEVDEGASIASLTRVSHIHLFGIAFIFLFLGWIFGLAEHPSGWKLILIATPFAFLILDVLSWWLTKYYPVFAWLTHARWHRLHLASTVMIFTSLIQMWLPRETWLAYWTVEESDS